MGRYKFSGFSRIILLHLRTQSRTFTELSISHSCRVLMVIVLLELEPSAQSEVLNAMDWVLIKAVSIFWCSKLFFNSDESFSPYRWKTALQHDEAATSTLYFWDGTLQVPSLPGFLQTWCLELRFIKPESLVSQSLSVPFRYFFANFKCVFMCLHWGEDCFWPHQHKAQIGVLQWCLSFCRFFLYPRISSRKDRITETTCFCETSMQYNVFLNSSPDVWFHANLSLSYAGGLFDLRAWFLL